MSEVVNGATVYYGLCIDLLNELAEHYNFTYNISEPEDGEWGRLVGDRWTGMVGQLVAHEVDLVMAPISMQSEREEVIDFVPVPFYHDYTTVLLKRPDPNTSKWRIVLEPFKTEVMICIAAVLIAATIILYLMERYSVFYKSDQRTIAIDEVFLYLLGALLVEGCSQLPRSLAGRTVMSCWWLFCIVIVASYGGKLFAFLAIPKYKLPFTNLDEMVGQSEYKWGMLGGTFRITIFETSSQPTFKHVWEGIQQFNASDPTTLGLTSEGHMDKVRKGGYAFIGDYTGMQIRMATECDLITTTDKFFPMLYGVGLPNESPYANIFAKQMLAIIEGGLIDIWKSKWWPKDYRCLDTSQRGAKPIRLVDIQSVFFAIAAMFLLALIALFVELWVVHFQRRRQTNVDLSCSNKPCSQIYDSK